jgi:hypothetical protein
MKFAPRPYSKANTGIHALDQERLSLKRDIHISMIALTASRERFQRCRAETMRRLNGVPVTREEVIDDLRGIVGCLLVHLTYYNNNLSNIFKHPKHAVIYCEHITIYALQDYPREFEEDSDIAGLWDALERIHIVSQAWRIGDYRCEAKAVISYIEMTARNAMNYIYPTLGDDDTVLEED